MSIVAILIVVAVAAVTWIAVAIGLALIAGGAIAERERHERPTSSAVRSRRAGRPHRSVII